MESGSLAGRRVLVTAGPTWVMLDAVRQLGNISSGHTGLVLARALRRHGAAVTLLIGPGQVRPTAEDLAALAVRPFVTFDELHAAVRTEVGSRAYDALIHAAAVSDYRPLQMESGKLPSGEEELIIRFRPTPKIVDEVRGLDPEILLVKFKLEVGRTREELLAIARASGERSDADMVVANDLTGIGEGRHAATILDREGEVADVGTAEELGEALTRELARRLRERPRRAAVPSPGGQVV